jgi:hypothetical protein
MVVLDRKQGIATDVGEFWAKDAEIGKEVIVGISLTEDRCVDFAFKDMNLVVPIDRLKKLLGGK